MTNVQLYLAMGAPVLFNFAIMLTFFLLLNGNINTRIDGVGKGFNQRLDAMEKSFNKRFDDMRDLWRAELHRVEEVLDARLKHIEEERR